MSTQYPGIENDEPEAPPGPIVGEVPGLEAGNTYPNRKALHSARVHNMLMHGISGEGRYRCAVVFGHPNEDQFFSDEPLHTLKK